MVLVGLSEPGVRRTVATATVVLVLLPNLWRVLPGRAELSGAMGAGPGRLAGLIPGHQYRMGPTSTCTKSDLG